MFSKIFFHQIYSIWLQLFFISVSCNSHLSTLLWTPNPSQNFFQLNFFQVRETKIGPLSLLLGLLLSLIQINFRMQFHENNDFWYQNTHTLSISINTIHLGPRRLHWIILLLSMKIILDRKITSSLSLLTLRDGEWNSICLFKFQSRTNKDDTHTHTDETKSDTRKCWK